MSEKPATEATSHPARGRSRHLVLTELARSGPITQPDIVRRTGLARATVATVVAELEREGRLVRDGRVSPARGRPAEMLSLRPVPGYVGAVDLGHAHLSVAVATSDGEVLAERTRDFDADLSGTASVEAAARDLREVMGETGVAGLAIVSLGVPGPLDHDVHGAITSGGVMSGWTDLQPLAHFARHFGEKVTLTLDNDAHLGAIGEHAYGAARGRRTALYVKVGAGIGSGIIIDNLVYRGGHGTAGEIGHIRVMEQGALCRCGGRGCLETVASTSFALRSLRAIHGDSLTFSDVEDLLRRADPGAVRLFEDMGEMIGRVVAGTASALDPEVVVVGSPIPGPSPLTTAIETTLGRHTQPFVASHTRIVPGLLCERASLLGAVARATRMARTLQAG